jgi:integrase
MEEDGGASFDHLVSAGEQRCWYFKPERFFGLGRRFRAG